MRDKPFSQELQEVSSAKDCQKLMEEISTLLKRLLDVDKRIFKKSEDKAIFKSRLELYSSLYRQTKTKFDELAIGSSYHKPPLSLEDFLEKYYYSKTIRFEEDDDDDEETSLLEDEVSSMVTDVINEKDRQKKSQEIYTTKDNLFNEFLKELETIMAKELTDKKILRRDDPEVLKDALHNSLVHFLDKYKDYTDKNTLEKVFHELRLKAASKTTLRETVTKLTGKVKVDEPIEPPTLNETETVLPTPPVKEVTTPVQEPMPTGETTTSSDDEEIVFKSLDKADQDLLIESVLNSIGLDKKAGAVKKEIENQGFKVNHYDDIYIPYERVKKKLNVTK
jgi:uncharacterized membrane protein YheB (UPF0754 family)